MKSENIIPLCLVLLLRATSVAAQTAYPDNTQGMNRPEPYAMPGPQTGYDNPGYQRENREELSVSRQRQMSYQNSATPQPRADYQSQPAQSFVTLPPPADSQGMTALDQYNSPDTQLNATIKSQWPYSPEDIARFYALFKQMNASQEVKEVPPKLEQRSISVSLLPEGNPPVIWIQPNYPTAVTFKDITGAPWNVLRVLGDKSFFDAQTNNKDTPTIYITPSADKDGHTYNGSIIVMLVNLDFPLAFDLRVAQADDNGRRVTDSTVEVKVPKAGPGARVEDLMDVAAFHAGDSIVQKFIHGYQPQGAEEMRIEPDNTDTRAWKYGDNIYLKTFGQVILPQPLAGERSPSGAGVFKLPDTPRATLSLNGVKTRLVIRERRFADGK